MNTLEITAFLNKYHGKKFSWGVMDCSTFLRDYLLFSTGIDYSNLATFSWRTKFMALRYAKESSSILGIFSKIKHTVLPNLNSASIGDLVVISQNGWHTAGVIYYGNRAAFMVEDHGIKLSKLDGLNIIKIVRAI